MRLRNRIITVLCLAAAAAGIAAAARGATRQRRRATGFDPREAAVNAATDSAIAPIDPEPITQIAGEGIDLDAPTGPGPRFDEVVEPALR